MPLEPIELEPVAGVLPADVAGFLAEAATRIDAYFENRRRVAVRGFVPSEYEPSFRLLRALVHLQGEAGRFCEWGSGFGVVTGLAALVGYEAYGIEIDPELVTASRRLLADQGVRAHILEGSFVPEDYARSERIWDLETVTILTGADVYGDFDLEIEDFDVVFAYPWPTEEEQYCDLFRRFADYGAVLLTYSMSEGTRAYRKVGGSGPDPG